LCLSGAAAERVVVQSRAAPTVRYIGDIPVFNYDMAFGGQASLSEMSSIDQEWNVFVKPGTTGGQVQQMCNSNKNGCHIVGHKFMQMRGNVNDLEVVIQESGGAVEFVEPDGEVDEVPEVPEAEEVGVQAATWGLNRIDADCRGNRGAGVFIYVQDTGVRYKHSEFGSRASSVLDLSTGKGIKECNGNRKCALDRRGHGTHCAGIAAGETYGVAPAAWIRGVKTLRDNGPGERSWQYEAIDWVAVNGDRPAVLSMGVGDSRVFPGWNSAIDAAVDAGVVVVVVAGNDGRDGCQFSPGSNAKAITVGATTSLDTRASFSNYGSCTNIWAPGSDVVSTSHRCNDCSDTLSGTSFAAPHVSGAAALILSAAPTKTASDVMQQLLDDAYLHVLSDLRFGDTNALLCVAEYGAPPTPTPQPTPAPLPGNWAVFGSGCEENGPCVQSLNFPSNYGNNEVCQIVLYGTVNISVEWIETEYRRDYFWVGAVGFNRFSGDEGLPSGEYSGEFTWSSDRSRTYPGWKLCKN